MRPVTVIRLAICLFAGLLLLGSAGLAWGIVTVLRKDTTDNKGITKSIAIRVPVKRVTVEKQYVPVEGALALGNGAPSSLSSHWSQFRGENRDAISPETISLRKNWTEEQPPPLLGKCRSAKGCPLLTPPDRDSIPTPTSCFVM